MCNTVQVNKVIHCYTLDIRRSDKEQEKLDEENLKNLENESTKARYQVCFVSLRITVSVLNVFALSGLMSTELKCSPNQTLSTLNHVWNALSDIHDRFIPLLYIHRLRVHHFVAFGCVPYCRLIGCVMISW